jgi:hypothetical protein
MTVDPHTPKRRLDVDAVRNPPPSPVQAADGDAAIRAVHLDPDHAVTSLRPLTATLPDAASEQAT